MMKKIYVKVMAIILAVSVLLSLSACAEQNSAETADCKFGEEFLLDGVLYKITKLQYSPENDKENLIAVKATVVFSSNKAPVSFPAGDPSQTVSLLSMSLNTDDNVYHSDPAVSFSMNSDTTDTEFPGQAVFSFWVDIDTVIKSATVYKDSGEDNKEKCTVDLTNVIIQEAETTAENQTNKDDTQKTIEWMSYKLNITEFRFLDEETEHKGKKLLRIYFYFHK